MSLDNGDGGNIEFYPQVPADAAISVRTLSMLDSAMSNLARGEVGKTLEPRDFVDDEGDEE